MDLIRPNTRIDFIGKKKYTLWISAIALLICLGSVFLFGGLKYGVDFAGGILIQVKFSTPVDISELRDAMDAMGATGSMGPLLVGARKPRCFSRQGAKGAYEI